MKQQRDIDYILLKRYKCFFILSSVCFSLSSFSLLFIPITDVLGIADEKLVRYLIASIFWSGILLGTIFLGATHKKYRVIERILWKNKIDTHKRKHLGIISFFNNPPAIVCDVILFFSAITFSVMILMGIADQWMNIICVWLLFLSFIMHSLLNGNNYKYICSYREMLKRKEHMQHE